MRQWIRDRTPRPEAADSAGQVKLNQAELNEAYQRGRRDERARHRRSPLAFMAISLSALAGAGILAVSAWQGSFERGGAMVDEQIVYSAQVAEPKIREAAVEARSLVDQAGEQARARTRDLVGG